MSYSIIGIHGLSNKPPEAHLADWWHQAMLEGLSKNEAIQLDSLSFTSVYWADVMYPNPDPEPDKYKEANAGDLVRYKDGWLDTVKDKARGIGGSFMDAMKEWFGVDKAATAVLEKKLPDLFRYYTEENTRAELRKKLKEAIKQNPNKKLMLVAHSMGSIIAYDVLRELGKENPQIAVEHFVTIGSPLGMPHVKYRISQESAPVRTPTIVKRWTNLADRRDPVAVDVHLADDYGPNSADVTVKDDLVLNDWGGINHKSYGYLRTPEFSQLLAQFISA